MKEIKIERTITNRNNDSLDRYLNEVGRYQVLEVEEEVALAKMIRMGDRSALQKLVKCNLRFVVSVAKKYEIPGISLCDLVAEGNIGLLKAAERFDETRGFKFISYAVWWIRQSILHSMSTYKRMVRLPGNQLKGIADLWNAEDLLEQRLHRLPTLQEVSEYMNLPYACILDFLSNAGFTTSFDAAIGEDHQEGKIDTMSDPAKALPDEDLDREALRINIELMMNILTTREQQVLRLAYGMGGERPLENRDIGALLGLSPETIRRAKLSALYRLRALSGIKMMKDYL